MIGYGDVRAVNSMSKGATSSGTAAWMEKYRDRLQSDRERLERDLAERSATAGVDDTAAAGVPRDEDTSNPDQGTDLYLREQDLGMQDAMRLEIRQIDVALNKIKEGSYGLCDRCGADLPRMRLDEIPSAIYCVACAEII